LSGPEVHDRTPPQTYPHSTGGGDEAWRPRPVRLGRREARTRVYPERADELVGQTIIHGRVIVQKEQIAVIEPFGDPADPEVSPAHGAQVARAADQADFGMRARDGIGGAVLGSVVDHDGSAGLVAEAGDAVQALQSGVPLVVTQDEDGEQLASLTGGCGRSYSTISMPDNHRRLLLIGLDAADIELVDRWTTDGTLPALAALRREGMWGPLATSARYLTGSPWPTFYTGQPCSEHGIYHDFQWRYERMEFAAPASDWLPVRPFWRAIEGDVFAIAHDVPMTPGTEPFNGIETTGWGSHDKLVPPESYPSEVLSQIRQRWGDSPIRTDEYGRASLKGLRSLHTELLDLTARSTEVASWLLERPWHLGIAVFGALHRGGHRFWDRSSIQGAVSPADGAWFDNALRELYRAADRAVGSLLAKAGDATVFVFALHGMMANTARVDFLDEMLARVLSGPVATRPKRGMLRRVGEAIPLPLRRALTHAVPGPIRNRLMTRWTTSGIDWARTQAFTLRADLHGYIRINLRGREPCGIVPPEEYHSLCRRISDGLSSFRDGTTGEPLIAEVCLASDVVPSASRNDRLPDLIVRWSETSAALHEAIEAPQLGRIVRATPGRIPNGRSGNHRSSGFLIARGPGIAAGTRLAPGADILDLPPTALARLGARSRVPLAGKVLHELAGS
jgi:predicted AlkP superfamily phosphohydrolase/phosphomutase